MLKGNGWVKVKKNNFMDFLCENKFLRVSEAQYKILDVS